MKFSPKVIGAIAVLGGFFALRGELTKWDENVSAGNRLEAVLFRSITLPSGAVSVRRPPKETRPELTKLITGSPNDEELYSIRALEAEQQLDFSAAEADWKKYSTVAADKGAGQLALADFYHRRLRPRDELNALIEAARIPAPSSEKFLAVTQQRPWMTYARQIRVIDDNRLDVLLGVDRYNEWIRAFPDHPELYRDLVAYTMSHEQYDIAGRIVDAYKQANPKDEEYPIEASADLLAKTGTQARAIELYDRSFRPLWPDSLIKQYFELLRNANALRAFLEKARAGVAANPTDLSNAARIFHYWRQQNNVLAGERVLAEFRLHKEAQRSPWTSEELLTLAELYERSHNESEAARYYYSLYNAARSNDAVAETALARLTMLLLTSPEQSIHLGSDNLTLYRDVATMDPHPGFLNGVLSLVLNGTDPKDKYAQEEQNASPYFRRAKAAELVALFESRFPNSTQRPELRERVIDAYAVYGANDGVIRAGTKFLTDFPNAANRTAVALRVADAYARTNQTQREFALYDTLLADLARRAGGVPLGTLIPAPAAKSEEPGVRNAPVADQFGSLHSPDYARVLDRYVARLVSLKRTRDALALYRREIDRNPNDPGLYDTLAAFLEQNKLGGETEAVYQRAIAQFQDHSWEHKLARWYLRQRRQADAARLTRDVVKIFSGTELAQYFQEIVTQAQPVGPALYLQLNLYAHERFPHHLAFVRNLLTAYSTRATANDAAYEALLRRHWYDAEDLRMRFFERLSRTGRLDAELTATRIASPSASAGKWDEAMDQSPAAVRTIAEGEAWRSHFEAAAPMFRAVETSFPADRSIGMRTAAIYRSLGTIDPKQTDTAIAVEERLSEADPRNRAALTIIGEIEADRERFDKARAAWDRIPEIEPAKSDGYLEVATIFWDYYRYDDALRWIEESRKRFKQDSLFAYEAGAIRENQRNYDRAILEYAKGALAQPGSNSERRLLLLARRPALHNQIDVVTSNLASDRNPRMSGFQLRVAILRNQNRRADMESFLLNVANRANSPEVLVAAENAARTDGYPNVQRVAIERQVAVTTDPVEKMRLRLALARFYEAQGNRTQSAATIDALYRENPAILGVVRATVDYHWRAKDTKRAVDVLEEAAGRANREYRAPFLTEAAKKSIEAGDYSRGRAIAQRLLADDPNRAEYVALVADTYARAGDDRGLRAFYDAKIREVGSSTLAPAQRTEQIAGMRRALIPILTRMQDYSGAMDQYIEILNRYPDDEALVHEASVYASQNGESKKLHDYYAKAATDSPKDYRWPLVLARIETQSEDYPAAIASYTRAAAVRPDRTDILVGRLNLEMRLLRFDEAAATAQKLYDLTYRNPAWMETVAEMRARQGRTADAVAALNKAFIEGRSDNAENYLTVAQRLEGWAMLPEARTFAEEAMKRSPEAAAQAWARILARQRDYDAVFARMATLPNNSITPVATTVGQIAATYSPDEKGRFSIALEKQPQRITIAQSAGLAELEVRWRIVAIMARPGSAASNRSIERLIALQKSRLKFDDLGAQLEAYDRALGPSSDTNHDAEAAECYRSSGNIAAETRVLKRIYDRGEANGPVLERYSQLLVAQPARLVAAITGQASTEAPNELLNYVFQHANATVAQQAIAARGKSTGMLWTKAYTGLAGLYYASNTVPVKAAFTDILGPMTVGARIGKPVNRDQQLAGDLWFYYGGRFGEYLSVTKQSGTEDYLPGMLEATSARSDSYFALAEFFNESGGIGAAAADYRNALELDPLRADAHDRLAMIASKQGRRDDAVGEWKLALDAFSQQMDRSHVPQSFWSDLSDTLRHIGEAKALPAVRDDVERILRTYIKRNGSFQIDPILEGAMAASGDATAGVTWIADLASSAADPASFLNSLIDKRWVTDAQRGILYQRIVELSQTQVAQKFGDARIQAENELLDRELKWAKFLVDRRENDRARQVLAMIPADARERLAYAIVPLEIRLAARSGTLPQLLSRYETSRQIDYVRQSATELRESGDAEPARRVLEFVYMRDLKAGNLDQSTFLGLAEIRLDEKDAAGAMALLRRMVLISGAPFSGLDPAAALLERTGHPQEAAEFLTTLTKAEPWNESAKRRLAEAQGTAPKPVEPVVTGDAASREKALLAMIAANPQPITPKFALFHTAIEARHYALAIAVGKQILPQYFQEDGEFESWTAQGFLSNRDRAERVSIARGLGEANQRLGNLRVALLYYQITQAIEPSNASRQSVTALRAQIDLNARNDARRPNASNGLDQDRLVRPKAGAR